MRQRVRALPNVEFRDRDDRLAHRFFRAAARVIDDPWLITRLFDLAMPHVALTARFPGRLRIVHHLPRHGGAPLPPTAPGIDYRNGRMDIRELAGLDADRWYLCGPDSLLSAARAALLNGGIARSRIHTELFVTREPEPAAPQPDRPPCTITLTGHGDDLVFTMPQGASILDAALTHREDLPYSCLGGSCGTCIATVRSGTVHMDEDPMIALTPAELADGAVPTCRAVPESAAATLRFGR